MHQFKSVDPSTYVKVVKKNLRKGLRLSFPGAFREYVRFAGRDIVLVNARWDLFKSYAVAKFFYPVSHDFVSFLNVFIIVLNFEFCLCLGSRAAWQHLKPARLQVPGQPEGRQANVVVQLVEVLRALHTIYRWRLRCIATFKDNF